MSETPTITTKKPRKLRVTPIPFYITEWEELMANPEMVLTITLKQPNTRAHGESEGCGAEPTEVDYD